MRNVICGGYCTLNKDCWHQKEKSLKKYLMIFLSLVGPAPLQDLEMEGKLADVYTRNISCREPVEKLYYVAKYPAICVYCAEPMMGNMDAVQQYLPQCDVCKNKPPISKK